MTIRKLCLLVILIVSGASCEEKQPDIEWNYLKAEITDRSSGNTDKLSVDIYLDVTTSMKGFVSAVPTNFSKLVDDIEGACQNVWRNTDIRYYKFGREVDSISRNEFISGKTSTAIYSNRLLSTQTNFDEAVKNTDYRRVSILITDFFYNNNDVNLVVNAIKSNCFQKGIEAGVIGLSSPFNGIVADVSPPVSVKGDRPLYVLVFGDRQNINLFFNTLKNKEYIKPNQLLLISNKPTENYEVSVVKDRKSKTINKQSLKKEWQDWGTVFNFRMREKETQADLNMEVILKLNEYAIPVEAKNLKTMVFKKTPGMKDSIPADNELTFHKISLSGDTLKADIRLRNSGDTKFSYLVYLTLHNTVPLKQPAWVKDLNTTVYTQGAGENKTLNLERLLTDISTNHVTYVQPKLAKFYINVEKK